MDPDEFCAILDEMIEEQQTIQQDYLRKVGLGQQQLAKTVANQINNQNEHLQ